MISDTLKDKNLCKVRTITAFITLGRDISTWEEKIQTTAQKNGALMERLNKKGYEVQTLRIVTNPFGEYIDTSSLRNALSGLEKIQQILSSLKMPKIRIRFSIGETKTQEEILLLPEIIAQYGDIANTCVNVPVDKNGVCDNALIGFCSNTVLEIAKKTPRGEGNFNFTVNFNCDPHIPYFPPAYHNSAREDCFALGLESPDLLKAALVEIKEKENHNSFFERAFQNLRGALQYHINIISQVAQNFSDEMNLPFKGIDTSAAPSKDCTSMDELFRLLGVEYFGSAGSLEVSSLLTKVFKSLENINIIGFSGLMLALTEDQGLADGTKQNNFDMRTLLMNSAVCGIGLDTVPVPGDISKEKINALMRDTGTLAFRLNKPLTVRLFPVPGKKAGDITEFESDDLCNARILGI